MIMIKRRKTVSWVISIFVCLIVACLLASYTATAQPAAQNANKEVSKEGEAAEKSKKAETFPAGPVDEYDPGSSILGPAQSAKMDR
jgi:hypothetical protein